MSNEYDDLIAQPTQEANEYDTALQLYGDQQHTQLRSSLAGAVQTNPDQYAKAKQLSAQTGVPAEVVHRNLPDVQHVAQVNEYDKLLQSSPTLQDQMRNSEFSKVAHDDLGVLSALEKSVQVGWRATRAAVAGTTTDIGSGLAGVGQAAFEGLSHYIGSPLAYFGVTPDDPFRDPAEWFAAQRREGQHLGDVIAGPNKDAGRLERDIEGGFRMFGQNAPATGAALLTGQPELALGLISAQAGGQQYGEARDQGVPVETALPYAVTQAGIQAVAAKLPLHTLLRNVNEASPLWKTFLQTTAAAVPSQEAATFLSNVNEWANLHPDKSFGDLMREQPSAMLDTLLQVTVASAGDTGLAGAARFADIRQQITRQRAAQVRADGANLEQLTTQAQASKLRERDPQSFQQFVDSAAANGPVQDIYVDARQFAQTLEQSGVDPREVARKSPAVAEQMPEALQTGGDLRIPLGEYAANMASEKYAEALLPHLRTSPDAMSAAEAQTFEQSEAERFKQDATAAMAAHQEGGDFQQSSARVEQSIFDQLGNANRFTPDVNRAYAQMVRDFYATQAHKLGITPEEMFARYPLKVQSEPLVGERQLDQPYHVPREENLSPEDHAIQERFAQQVEGNVDKQIDDYAKLPESDGGKILNTDIARELSPDYAKDRSKSAAVHEPASALVKEIYKRKLAEAPREGQDAHVVFSAGGTGAGKTTSLRLLEKVDPTVARAQIVYDTNMNGLQSSVKKIEQALAADKSVTILYTYRHPVEAFTQGMLGRAARMEGERGSGRTVPLIEHAKTHVGSLKVIRDLAQRYAEDPRVVIRTYDNSLGRGRARATEVVALPHFDYNSLVGELRNVLESERQSGRISNAVYTGVRGAEEGSNQATRRELRQGDERAGPGVREGTGGVLQQGVRGQITFARDLSQPSVISLLRNADLSTFLHESGHFFLEVYSDLASREGAPEAIKNDTDALLKWFGVKDLDTWRGMSLEQRREMHEKFARGFEAYLFDGKAPNHEMQGIFNRFRSWLLNVYRSLTNLHVDLTPEVRGVFDRMLATDQQIQITEAMRAYQPLFANRKQAGMTEAEWRGYQAIGQQATADAQEELQKRSLRDMKWSSNARANVLKELQADAEEKRKATRAEVAAEVQNEPIYRAQKALRSGKIVAADGTETKGFRLNTEALKEMGVADDLRGMTSVNGLHPDQVAEIFGFPSGDEFVRQLLNVEPMKAVIDAATDQRMLEKYGDITDPVAMGRAADAAVHNEARSRFVATELRALGRAMNVREKTPRGGTVNILTRVAKQFAEATIGRKKVGDVKPAQFDAAETRAAKAAEAATRKGDLNAAVMEKRNQLINGYASRAAHEALKDIDRGLDYLKKFDRAAVRDKIDLEYRDQIDALLDRFDLRKSVTNAERGKREALVAFVDRMGSMGYEPSVPQYLLDEANRQHYKDMTVEQFRGLVDSVKSIEHLGRLKNKLLDLQEERELSAVAEEAVATMEKLPSQVGAQSNRGLTRIEKKWANAKSAGRSLGASLLKMEQMMDWLDARSPNGVFNRVAFRRIADAGGREMDMQRAMSGRFKGLVSAIPDEALKSRRVYVADGLTDSVTGQPARFTKKELLALAGNVGNESNMAKVLAGEGWTEPALWDFLHKNMTKGDWDFVQGIGEAFESLWPEKLAMSRRLGNTNPEKIEPRPFDTPHGEYKGWYWPIVYDPARSQDVAERSARQGEAMFENIYRRANTDTGRMNTRVEGYTRPVLFDLDAIPRVIKDEIHDIAYREAIIDADKLLSHKDVRRGIIEALGREYYDQLRPWLQSIANDKAVDGAALKFWEGLAHGARTRATMAGLGFRMTTMLVHGTSAGLESVAELGPKWFGSGLADFRNPLQWRENRDFVFERSAEMRNRMKEVDRDIREHLREIDLRMSDPATGAVQRGVDAVKAHAYMGIAMLDMASALPTWMGAYKKAMTPAERGGLDMGEADAVYYADKTVRNAHGGTGAKDLAAVQRGNEFFKLFTMFYSFWNHNVNRLRDTARLAASLPATARSGNAKQFRGDLGMVIMRTLIYTLGIQVIHSALHPDKGEEGWGAWAAKQLIGSATSGIPVVRDLSAHFVQGRDYSVTPAAQVVQTVGQSAHDVQAAAMGRSSGKWVKHAAETAGYVFGLPLGQAASTGQFLWDVGDGKQDPQSMADWWNGLLYGDMHHN